MALSVRISTDDDRLTSMTAAFIDAQGVQLMLPLLTVEHDDDPELQYQACWVITNVAASPDDAHCAYLLHHSDAVATLLQLLQRTPNI
eukprot:SAG31_NODE_28679_length_406_cov_1.452769_1_plen_87_part_01